MLIASKKNLWKSVGITEAKRIQLCIDGHGFVIIKIFSAQEAIINAGVHKLLVRGILWYNKVTKYSMLQKKQQSKISCLWSLIVISGARHFFFLLYFTWLSLSILTMAVDTIMYTLLWLWSTGTIHLLLVRTGRNSWYKRPWSVSKNINLWLFFVFVGPFCSIFVFGKV